MLRALGLTGIALALALVAAWLAARSGAAVEPRWLAAGAGALLVLIAVQLAAAVPGAFRARGRRVAATGRALSLAGAAVVLGGGLANWLYGIQGFVLLTEDESAELARSDRFRAIEAGPLSDPTDLGMSLQLARVRLVADGPVHFRPRSELRVRHAGASSEIHVEPGVSGGAGSLRFYQGAFGFSPRIVVLKRQETVLDEHVPFTTERRGDEGITFTGELSIAREELSISGAVTLDTLDERMKGHPRLVLGVSRRGEPLGAGDLMPGQFAELADGYRVGFAGLKRWSEIDVSRRNYAPVMRLGVALLLAGAVLWPLGARRAR